MSKDINKKIADELKEVNKNLRKLIRILEASRKGDVEDE